MTHDETAGAEPAGQSLGAGADGEATVERFDHYVERCLYGPGTGFYTSAVGTAGRRGGDFITGPEVGPLFAEVVARALDAWWAELGRPDPYVVIDAGSGPGTLARGLERAPGPSAAARRVVTVDRAPGHGAPTADEALGPGVDVAGAVVVANELLDNIPFRVAERVAGGWAELHVGRDRDGRPGEVLVPSDFGPLLPADAESLPVGTRVPVLEGARRWMEAVLARRPAVVLVFDYGSPTTVELGRRGGWLRTYRQHQRGHDPLREPGRWDITTDLAVDQLPGPTEVVDQAGFLRRWGIDELVDEGRRRWAAGAAAPDLTALRMRSRAVEAEALLDPLGLGSWLVCRWSGP
ncbi:MAG: SAM-dependent methyltransferase [Acidimicrobiales bacterium]